MKKILAITGILFLILSVMTCSGQKLSNVNEQEIKVVTELQDKIKKLVPDQERKNALLKITAQIEQETRSFYSFYQEHNKKLSRVNKNYNTTRQDFEVIINEFNDKYENYLNTLIQKRSRMKEFTTDEEWEKIMDREYSFIPG